MYILLNKVARMFSNITCLMCHSARQQASKMSIICFVCPVQQRFNEKPESDHKPTFHQVIINTKDEYFLPMWCVHGLQKTGKETNKRIYYWQRSQKMKSNDSGTGDVNDIEYHQYYKTENVTNSKWYKTQKLNNRYDFSGAIYHHNIARVNQKAT